MTAANTIVGSGRPSGPHAPGPGGRSAGASRGRSGALCRGRTLRPDLRRAGRGRSPADGAAAPRPLAGELLSPAGRLRPARPFPGLAGRRRDRLPSQPPPRPGIVRRAAGGAGSRPGRPADRDRLFAAALAVFLALGGRQKDLMDLTAAPGIEQAVAVGFRSWPRLGCLSCAMLAVRSARRVGRIRAAGTGLTAGFVFLCFHHRFHPVIDGLSCRRRRGGHDRRSRALSTTTTPRVGPADVRTRLRDASYFFLGNGLIQAAVQFAPSGEGTPLGLLIMDPERLGKKREALTMDPEAGLARDDAGDRSGRQADSSGRAPGLRVAWEDRDGIPAVRAVWKVGRPAGGRVVLLPRPGVSRSGSGDLRAGTVPPPRHAADPDRGSRLA